MDELIEILRDMYATQIETDEQGAREVACYYYQEQIEAALAAVVGHPVELTPEV